MISTENILLVVRSACRETGQLTDAANDERNAEPEPMPEHQVRMINSYNSEEYCEYDGCWAVWYVFPQRIAVV